MITHLTAEDLIRFETEIAELFNAGKIRAPIHLYQGNEMEMLQVFADVYPEDWVCCPWRSHYQCLLKGVPPDEVREAILDGKSIALCFPRYRVISSAIVGGILPIATGIAMGLQRANTRARVHCFLGDMTSETGMAHECIKYATNWDLPIRFIIEDNNRSTCTDTRAAWNQKVLTYEGTPHSKVMRYPYTSKYPHSGAGVRVQF